MSYIQGTVVVVTIGVRDKDTNALVDPPDVSLAVKQPTGGLVIQAYADGSGVERLGQGRYRASVQTPEAGRYEYEAAALGPNASKRQRAFEVLPALS